MSGYGQLEKDRSTAIEVGRQVAQQQMTVSEGRKTVSLLADMHPLCPTFFSVLGEIELISRELDEWRPGYLALARLKGRHFDPDPCYERVINASPLLEMMTIDSDIHKDEARQSLYDFYGRQAPRKAGAHLLAHLLLQDLLEQSGGFSGQQSGLYLSERSALLPLFLNLEGGLEDVMSSEGRIPDLTGVYLILGAYAAPEALPLMLRGLEWCTGTALNEAVLALAKTGFHHPRATTAAVRSILENGSKGGGLRESLISAVDVLGLLGSLEGNHQYLARLARRLGRNDLVNLEMTAFAAESLRMSGVPEFESAGTLLLEEVSPLLEEDDSVEIIRDFKLFEEVGATRLPAGSRQHLEAIAGEDVASLLARPWGEMPGLFEILDGPRPWELTLTTLREKDLECRVKEGFTPDLDSYRDLQEGWTLPKMDNDSSDLPDELPWAYRRVLAKLISFFREPEYARDASLALRHFCGAAGRKRLKSSFTLPHCTPDEVAFHDWALLTRPLLKEGHPPAREYLELNGDEMWSDESEYLKALIDSRLSLFEDLGEDKRGGSKVRDVIRGDVLQVRYVSGGGGSEPRGFFISRIGETAHGWEIMGPVHPVPPELRDDYENGVLELSVRPR